MPSEQEAAAERRGLLADARSMQRHACFLFAAEADGQPWFTCSKARALILLLQKYLHVWVLLPLRTTCAVQGFQIPPLLSTLQEDMDLMTAAWDTDANTRRVLSMHVAEINEVARALFEVGQFIRSELGDPPTQLGSFDDEMCRVRRLPDHLRRPPLPR